ncbi:hypothetical protein FPCIR_12642 [Fusarium pseudocircinatum]|uniref:Uncharacterized protein n=1 Tax=Fusarium pseudocircinatum TaxID=56676 RepID=A0A8H5NTH2_9HYPO|nr:hypothetical protein FPCIR_12642 [Fusarium pseudocircinatum]
MFDRIRRAIICLTTSDDWEIRNKLDEVKFRREVIEEDILEGRSILAEMIARKKLELQRRWEYNKAKRDLKDRNRKQKDERKRAAKVQASQKKPRSEGCPYGMMPSSKRRPVAAKQASIPEMYL